MAFKLVELTRETSTSTTGAYVLGGAPAGYNPFSAGLSNNDVTAYTVFEQAPPGAPIWAEYFGAYSSGGNSLSRGTFIRSSTGADISPWGAGTRNVVCGLQGAQIESLISLLQAGSTGGLELVTGSPMPTFGVHTVTAFAKTLLDDASFITARITLNVVPGTHVQAWDADLDAIAALAKTDNNFIVGNGSTWVAESGATARTSLGLGSIAVLNTPVRTWTPKASDDVITTSLSSEKIVGSFDRLDFPGTPDGSNKYLLRAMVGIQTDAGFGGTESDFIARLRVGSSGSGLTDTLRSIGGFAIGTDKAGSVYEINLQTEVTPTNSPDERVSLTIQQTNSAATPVNYSVIAVATNLEIVEVLD